MRSSKKVLPSPYRYHPSSWFPPSLACLEGRCDARRSSSHLISVKKKNHTQKMVEQKNRRPVPGRHPWTAFLPWACRLLGFLLHKKTESLPCLSLLSNRFPVNAAEMQSSARRHAKVLEGKGFPVEPPSFPAYLTGGE